MTTRIIETEQDRKLLLRFLEKKAAPFTISITSGKKRSLLQNSLQRLWMREISDQSGYTPEEARAYCKLTFGVPIRCAEDEEYRIAYERDIRPLPAKLRLSLMAEPHDHAVTRDMTTKQKAQYLDDIFRFFTGELGIELTKPNQPPMEAAA